MTLLVHFALKRKLKSIRSLGIEPLQLGRGAPDGFGQLVFAVPVANRFYVSHQWLRTLSRDEQSLIYGVYFWFPDDQLVLISHYNKNHSEMNAGDAVNLITSMEKAEGYEIVIPRRIDPEEINRVKKSPQIRGWQHDPNSKRKKSCKCPVCIRPAKQKTRRIRDAHEIAYLD